MTNQPIFSRAPSGRFAVLTRLLAVTVLLIPTGLRAQVSFEGTQTTVASFPSSDRLSPVAVDANGDTFFVASASGVNTLYEAPAGGTLTTLNGAFPFAPNAIAANQQGTELFFIYTASTGGCNGANSALIALASVSQGTTPANLPCSFLMFGNTVSYSNPTGLAVDQSGDLLIADFGAADIYEIPAPVSSTSVPANVAGISSGQPYDIAVLENATIYFTLSGTLPPGGQTSVAAIPFTNLVGGMGVTLETLASNVPSIESGLAVDPSGNVYLGGGTAAVSKVSAGNLIPVNSEFVNGTDGLGTDSAGDLFIAGAEASGEQLVVEMSLNTSAVNFGTQAVGSSSQTSTLTFTVAEGASVGSIAALTTGVADKDFVIASGGTCVTGTYSSETTCTVNVNFAPQAPGLRRGALVFSDSSNNALVSVPLSGVGTGPQVVYQGGLATEIGAGLTNPLGIKTDVAGNVFVADTGNQRVVKITPAGVQTQVGPTFGQPTDVAIDGAGNVFVADAQTNEVYKVTPAGLEIPYLPELPGPPHGLAMDGAGNLYVSVLSPAQVFKVTPTGGELPVGSGFTSPHGIDVDSAGDVYVADCSTGVVYEVNPSGNQTAAGLNLGCPTGVAVDAGGDLYVTSNMVGNLFELAAGAPLGTPGTNLLINLNAPSGLALDSSGNVYFVQATIGLGTAYTINRAVPPALSFSTTAGGSTSANSPQTVTLQNIGNMALGFPAISFPADFPEAEPNSDCTTSTSLTAGSNCPLTIDFSPVTVNGTSTSIPLAENVQFTTNALNGATPQNIPVSGTETKKSQTVAFTPPASVQYGTPPINLASFGSASSSLTLTFSLISGPATVAGSTLTITGAGSVVIQANQTGSDVYSAAASVTQTITVTKAVLTVTANDASRVYGVANPTFTDVITGFVNGDTQSVVSGTPSNSTTATVSSQVGTYPIAPAQGTLSAANYTFQFGNGTLTITQATPSISWPAPPAITYGTALSATQLDATSPVAGTFAYSPPVATVLTAGTHTLSVTFTPTDATDYTTAMTTVQLTVNQATPTINWTAPPAITYGTALSATQLDATSTVAGTFAYNPPAATVLTAGTHTLSVTLTPTDATDYTTAMTTVQLTVNQAKPLLSWATPAAITYGTALSTTQLDATSTVAGTFAYNPPAATVLTAGTHTLSVTFTPTDATDYTTVTTTVQLTVNQATPSLSWAAPAAITYGTALGATQLNASSPVAGTFAYNPPAATVLTAGTHTLSVTFTPTDATDYTTASTTVQLTVNQAKPAINWAAPAAITYGTALGATQLDASSPVAGTFAYNPPAATVLTAGTHTLSVTFTPTDATDYTAAATTVQLTVNQAVPPINWPTPAPISYGTAVSSVQLDATSTVPGTFSYIPPVGTVLPAGTQTLSATFTPADTADYTTPTVQVTLKVDQATPVISWASPAGITYGAALSATQLDASSTVAGTFAYSPAPATVLTAGTHSLSVTFTPTDATDYTTAMDTVQLTVNQATPTISWASPAAITYGTALSSTQLDASSPVAGTFAYNPPAATVLTAGTHTLSVTLTPTDATDYATATDSVQLTVSQATPTLSWPTPAAITYGTALGATQLDASSAVAGTFAYNPPAGTMLTAGTHTLSVTFTPTDATDYTTATTTVQLTVKQATPTINWTAPTAIPYGTALSATQLDATSPISGSFNYIPPAGTVLPTGVQTLSATFMPADTADYTTASATVQLTVTKATPAINWPAPAAITYGTALSATQLDANSPVSGTFVYSPTAATVLTAGMHTLSVTFTPTDTTDYNTATTTVQLTVNQATPTINWAAPAAITYGTALSATQLDANSPVAGTFVYNPLAAAVLTAGTHTLSVTFTPTDATDYTTATATVQLTVNQATPSLIWATPAAITYGTGLSATQLDATSTVAGTFTYSPPAGTVLAAGVHALSVNFTPTDATDYTSASTSVQITVSQATPAISWPAPSAVTYGTALGATQLDASSAVAGTFAYNPAAGTVLTVGTHRLSVTFAPTDAADYTTAMATAQLTVNQATPSISWPAPAAITYGTALSATQLNATSPVAGTFTFIPPAGTVLPVGLQTLSATFTPTDTADYTTTSATVQLTVKQATPAISWPVPSSINYGTALSGTQLDATSLVAGSFVYNPAAGTMLTAGTHTLSVTFTPADSADYTTATATVGLTVNQAIPSISWATPAAITYGAALSATQLDATSPITGTFAYSPAAGTVLTAGTHTLSVTFTPTDATDYTTAMDTVQLTVNQATPTISWASPAAITYGTALSSTQLDASSPVAGTFAYNPPAATVLTAGTHTLSVILTPTDATDYATATDSVQLTVSQATPTLSWPTPAAITYGTALGATQLNATSSVAGTFAYNPPAGTMLTAGTHTLSVTFTPTDASDYTTATTTVQLTVNQATPSITWATPTAITYGTALGATQLDATSPITGTFAYTPAAGAVLTAGTHTLSATFTPADATDYATATATVLLTVNQATPAINWATPAAITYGTALSATQLDASSTVAGTFAYNPPAATVLTAGTHTLSVTFTPADGTDYSAATANVTLKVNKAIPQISWVTPKVIPYGAPLSETELDATARIPGTFVYDPPRGTVLDAGTQKLSVAFTPADKTDYATSTAETTLQVNQKLLTVAATNVSVVYGKPLPKLTYTVSGFADGQTAKVLSGSPDETTTAKELSAVGQYPIAITAGTLNSRNYKFTFKDATLTITPIGKAAPPAFKPAAGTYKSAQTVTITDTTPGAEIYFTTDGTIPTTASTRYTKAIHVGATETIKSFVAAPGYTNSPVIAAKYTIE
jgi:hypothetical protein